MNAALGVAVLIAGQCRFHLVDAALDVFGLSLGKVFVVGNPVAEVDVARGDKGTVIQHGTVFRHVHRLAAVVAFHLHQVAAAEFVALLARVIEMEAVPAFGNDLRQDIDAIVDAVVDDLAVAALRRVFHPGPRNFKGQQVAQHALVGIRAQQCPVVVLAHAQQRHFHPRAALFQRAVQRPEGVGLFGTVGIGTLAAVANADIAVILDVLSSIKINIQ